MTENIRVEVITNGKTYLGEINRQRFKHVIDHLRKEFFWYNNEITDLLLKEIPIMVTFGVPMDLNMSKDDPVIYYKTLFDTRTIEIRRCHKIIWGIIDGYCDEIIQIEE